MSNVRTGTANKAFTGLTAGVILWMLCLANTGIAQGVTRTAARAGTIGAGATIKVRTNEAIKTSNSDGQVFTGVVEQNVVGSNGKVVIPKGSHAELKVKRLSDNDVALDLESVTINGQRYGVEAENKVVPSQQKQGVGKNKRTGKYVGGGAALGAIIGAIAGGGKGAAIGAGVGAGAGAGAQILTRGKSVKVPAESLLTFRVTQPLRSGG